MSSDPNVDEPTTVIFNLMCPDPRAWVVLSRDGMASRVVEMWQPRAGFWTACALVSPGEYRCRCYGGTHRTFTYCGPPQVEGAIERGIDAVLVVRESTARDSDPLSPSRNPEMAHA